MADSIVKFQNEGIEGVVAVGSFLADVMSRMGVLATDADNSLEGKRLSRVVIVSGEEFLSEPTDAEKEHFAGDSRKGYERLPFFTQIVKPGEIVIMTTTKEQQKSQDTAAKDPIQAEFEALPLEKKIASLFRMEAVTLGETFSYVLDSPYKIFEKIGDVMAEFGMKLEKEAKKAARPSEPSSTVRQPENKNEQTKGDSQARKTRNPRKSQD